MYNEWEKFRDLVKKCTCELHGMNGAVWSERWSEKVGVAVAEKKKII